MKAIIDTNVPIVANGDASQTSPECALVCIQRLQEIMSNGQLVLDRQWQIVGEYMRRLCSSGQPGIGDAFLKWVLINRANPQRCELVDITPVDPNDPNETDFKEFPTGDPALEDFDPADRKFVAVACAHPEHPPVFQAADYKWWRFCEALAAHGVRVEFLCEDDLQRWLEEHEEDSDYDPT
jgi:hypothetical protein